MLLFIHSYLVFQAKRCESGEEAREDLEASEVEEMMYFVGTTLGKRHQQHWEGLQVLLVEMVIMFFLFLVYLDNSVSVT